MYEGYVGTDPIEEQAYNYRKQMWGEHGRVPASALENAFKAGFNAAKGEAKEMYRELLDVLGECDHWDHQGYCQTHWLHEKENCPVRKMGDLLREWEKVDGE